MELKTNRKFGDSFFTLENNKLEEYKLTSVTFIADKNNMPMEYKYEVSHSTCKRHETILIPEIGIKWFLSKKDLVKYLIG